MPRATATPARLLERALIFNFVIHAIALLAMAAFLLPTLPGGTVPDDGARIARIAAHPWLFRIGWFPWQVTAFADLALAIALVATRFVPRVPALAGLVLTIAAVIPDQAAQAMLISEGVERARAAHTSGDLELYLAFEREWFPLTSAWAATGYTAGACAWSVAFARAGTWSRTLTRLSVVTWTIFAVVSVGPLLPRPYTLAQPIVSLGNALAFPLFELWVLLVLEQVLRRSRPLEPHGRMAVWRHPARGVGRWWDVIANSRALRALLERMPVLSFASEIEDVIYVNYLVDAERLEKLVPHGLELERVGDDGRHAVFTHLTYRHGHFGPRLLGPLRRLMSSPLQSNWRIHVIDPRTRVRGIYFVTTAISSTADALAARLLCEGLPMHVPARSELRRDASGTIQLRLDPGAGSAPDIEATLRPAGDRALPAEWRQCFIDREAMLGYIVPQDRAISTQPWLARITRHEIDLGIPLTACELLEGDVRSRAAAAIAGGARPICFRVPSVAFLFEREIRDPLLETC